MAGELELENELETDEAQSEQTSESETELDAGQESALRRFQSRVAYILAWLRRPDEVGQPLTLQPQGVRLLVLLVLGNLIVVVLLIVWLYQASVAPGPPLSPLLIPVIATASPDPSSTPGAPPTPGPTSTP